MMLRRALLVLSTIAVLAGAADAQQPPPKQQDEFVPVSELPPEEQLPAQPLLVAAYGFTWLAVAAYVVSIAQRLDNVKREIDRLEAETKRR
jgi:CcmD family protein